MKGEYDWGDFIEREEKEGHCRWQRLHMQKHGRINQSYSLENLKWPCLLGAEAMGKNLRSQARRDQRTGPG